MPMLYNLVRISDIPGLIRVSLTLNKEQVQQLVQLVATAKIVNAQNINEDLLKMLHEAAGLLEIPF